MGTKRCAQLLRRIRERSDNLDYGSESGISDEQLVDYINDGLAKMQSHLAEQHSEAFGTTALLSLTPGVEQYDLPEEMLEGAGLLLVEHKFDSQYYRKLNKVSMGERSDGSTYDPRSYIRKGRRIYLRPIPARGSDDELRIEYVRRWDRIGVRRGTVTAATIGTSVTDITVATKLYNTGDEFRDSDLRQADLNSILGSDYICIVDRDGNYLAKNIPIDTDLSPITGVTSIQLSVPSHILADGETIPVGAYIVLEKDTSTHQLELDRTMERFLIEFSVWRVKSQDASNEAYEQQGYLKSIMDDILAAYAMMDNTVQLIPELPEY